MARNVIWPAIIYFLFFWISATQASEKKTADYFANWALKNLEQEIQRAAHLAGGIVGVSALHLESGRHIGFNAQERFPMASVYKIPIAVQLLHSVDQGELPLNKMITIQATDLRPGSSLISSYLFSPGVILSVRNLLELMLVASDNTATDVLLRLAGGPSAVTARLRDMGILDMDVSRPTVILIAEATGFPLPPESQWSLELFKKLHEEVPPEIKKMAVEKFLHDRRDTSTPEAMTKLLRSICQGDYLKDESKNLLLEIMGRCQTSKKRLRGILLPEVAVAHKTGTLAGVINDAGIITLPSNAGKVAIAIFVKASDKSVSEREQGIAQIARAIYDFFLFNPYPNR